MKFILAQGNPDRKYAETRHNTGFKALDVFGKANDAIWKDVDKFNARIAELSVDGQKVLLIKPSSFYNETGRVARQLLDFYKADAAQDLLVVHDDLALPFGTIRIREQGSDAGNNGVKSLNAHLGENYHRIRIGVWSEGRDQMNDVDFVLGRFSKDEEKKLEKDILPHVSSLIDQFISGNLEKTSHNLDA